MFGTNWSLFKKCDQLVNRLSESKRGVFICIIVLIVSVVRGGINYSFGTFTVSLEAEFNKSMAEANWIGTIPFGLSQTLAPISVAVVRFFGYRGYQITGVFGIGIMSVCCFSSSFASSLEWMFLIYSVPMGIGCSLNYMACSLIIGEWFNKHHRFHVLTTSVLLCGYTLGSLLFNPFNAWLLKNLSWRATFRVNGLILGCVGIPLSLLFVSKETPNELETVKESDFNCVKDFCKDFCRDLRRLPEIPLWILGNFVNYMCYLTPFLNLASYMKSKGVTFVDASLAITLLSLFEALGYVAASLFGDKIKGRLIYMNVFASFGLTIICAIWPTVDVDYPVILGVSIVYGTFLGLSIVYSYAASGEVTQLPLDVAWSYTNMCMGCAIFLGPLFSGLVYDKLQSYDGVFYVNAVVYGVDIMMFGAIAIIREKWRISKVPYEELDEENISKKEYEQTFRVIKRKISKPEISE